MSHNGTLPNMHDKQTPRVIVHRIVRRSAPLYPDDLPVEAALIDEPRQETWIHRLLKAEETLAFGTNQGVTEGIKYPIFDREEIKKLMRRNAHHSACIHAKVNATVGLGHLTAEEKKAREMIAAGDPAGSILLQQAMGTVSRVDETLTPLCESTWAQTISDVCHDIHQTHTGYLEIVKADSSKNAKITGVHWIPAEHCKVVIEANRIDRHYVVHGSDGGLSRRFARYGDLANFLQRYNEQITPNSGEGAEVPETDREDGRSTTSEVIEFRVPNAVDRYYGYPDFLSSLAHMELVSCINQQQYDFFINRGVPEFMLFIKGAKLGTAENTAITNALNAQVGQGNSHNSIYLNLEDKDVEIVLEKLAVEGKTDNSFAELNESCAGSIVTAHRTPPLLAGIQIPGKLGATNELPNALVAFQTLVIGPIQNMIHQILSATLGNAKLNGGLGLKAEDFLFRRITEAFDLGAMDTMARMRQTAPEAQAEGRNLRAGVKK